MDFTDNLHDFLIIFLWRIELNELDRIILSLRNLAIGSRMFNIIPSEEKDKNPKNPICATLSLMKILEIVQYIFTFWKKTNF